MPGYQGLLVFLAVASFSPLSAAEPAAASRAWTDADSLRTCRALALSDPRQCDAPGAHTLCGHFYLQGVFAKAALSRSPRAQRACEAVFASEGGAVPATLGAKACASLIRRKYSEGCALLRAEVKDSASFSLKTCEDDFRMFLGEDGACVKMPADAQDFCRGVAALRAKTKGACRREPYCRALSGEGAAACAPVESRLKEKAP